MRVRHQPLERESPARPFRRRDPPVPADVGARARQPHELPHLIAEMPGKDPDDHEHEHMSAAIVGGATVLLTHNNKDFPTKPLAMQGLRVSAFPT